MNCFIFKPALPYEENLNSFGGKFRPVIKICQLVTHNEALLVSSFLALNQRIKQVNCTVHIRRIGFGFELLIDFVEPFYKGGRNTIKLSVNISKLHVKSGIDFVKSLVGGGNLRGHAPILAR
jgi:hypothetical protein